jgi:hypothetical protein
MSANHHSTHVRADGALAACMHAYGTGFEFIDALDLDVQYCCMPAQLKIAHSVLSFAGERLEPDGHEQVIVQAHLNRT